jgi:transcriptional regulator with XRE-family HTH domain
MDHEHFCSSLGGILKAARLKKGMTQYSLADAAGMKRRYIQSIENGYQEATLSTFFSLAQAMNVSPMLLMGELEYAVQHGCLPQSVQEGLPAKKIGRPKKSR